MRLFYFLNSSHPTRPGWCGLYVREQFYAHRKEEVVVLYFSYLFIIPHPRNEVLVLVLMPASHSWVGSYLTQTALLFELF